MTRIRSKPIWVLAALAVLGLALSGCREDEQGRLLTIEKGKYLGPAPTELSEKQLDELRLRARNQKAN